jgi:hypothetical protein
VLYIPRGHALPTNSGYSAAALVSVAILVLALAASAMFALPGNVRPVWFHSLRTRRAEATPWTQSSGGRS